MSTHQSVALTVSNNEMPIYGEDNDIPDCVITHLFSILSTLYYIRSASKRLTRIQKICPTLGPI